MSIQKSVGATNCRERLQERESPLLANRLRKGKFDTWLILFFLVCLFEGVFYEQIAQLVSNRGLLIFRLTPYNLFPTDLFLLPISVGLLLFTRPAKNAAAASKRSHLLMTWWIICTAATLAGYLNHNLYLPADVRNYFIRSIVAFTIYRLALQSNIRLVFDRIINFSVMVSVFLTLNRIASLIGINIIYISDWGTLVLLLPFCILVMRIMVKDYASGSTLSKVLVIAIGILQQFWKPTVFGFIVAILLAFLMPISQSNLNKETPLFQRIWRMAPGILLIFLAADLIYFVNSDYYLSTFRYTYLKEGFVIQDLSGNRFQIWAKVIDLWRQNPILGVGFGTTLQGYLLHSGTGAYMYLDQIYIHNIALQFLYQVGVIGLLVVIALVIRWFFLTHQMAKSVPQDMAGHYLGVVMFCILTLIIALIGEALRYTPTGFLFWAALGMEAALAVQIEQDCSMLSKNLPD